MGIIVRLFILMLIAIGVGIFARANNGYVLISTSLFQLETSVNFLLLTWVLSLVIFYFIVKTIWGIRWLAQWRRRKAETHKD